MAYNIQLALKGIEEVNSLVDKNEIEGANGALATFQTFLDSTKEIGSYSSKNWQSNLTEKVYKLGEKLSNKSPVKFIEEIENRIKENDPNNIEFLHFIISEIKFNCLTNEESLEHINSLIAAYPFNPEFRQTICTYHSKNGNYSEAIKQADLAFKYGQNDSFKSSKFQAEYGYVNKLIEEEKYLQAQVEIDRIIQSKIYKGDPIMNNIFVDFKIRVKDILTFQDKISSIEQKMKERLDVELDKDRKRVIEVLGFFSAIIAFILTTVSLGKNFSFLEAIYFIMAIGIVLILFSISMSVLFNSNNKAVWKSPQIWILIISLFLFLVFILCSEGISILLSNFNW